jgi:glucose-1-phosphate thymidylyltransferase
MKGIILAGGSGTRLHPLTRVVSKQLLPVYDKPMIYYPLSTLMMAGIREILIISTPHDLPHFKKLFGDGSQLGLKLEYCEQPSPDGLAQAFILGERFLNGSPSCLVLGDNIFYGAGLGPILKQAAQLTKGAQIFGYQVQDPERYGVVEFASDPVAAQGPVRVISLEEKPKVPKSNYAIPGIYFYDSHASKLARSLRPSARGELEITDLNRLYLERGELTCSPLGRGFAWLDTGTHDSLLEASEFIAIIERRQGLKVGCVEEIAVKEGFLSSQDLRTLAESYGKGTYASYVRSIVANRDF